MDWTTRNQTASSIPTTWPGHSHHHEKTRRLPASWEICFHFNGRCIKRSTLTDVTDFHSQTGQGHAYAYAKYEVIAFRAERQRDRRKPLTAWAISRSPQTEINEYATIFSTDNFQYPSISPGNRFLRLHMGVMQGCRCGMEMYVWLSVVSEAIYMWRAYFPAWSSGKKIRGCAPHFLWYPPQVFAEMAHV